SSQSAPHKAVSRYAPYVDCFEFYLEVVNMKYCHCLTGEPPPSTTKPTTPTAPAKQAKAKIAMSSFKPLAELVRPSALQDYVGQEEAVGEKTLLRKLIG